MNRIETAVATAAERLALESDPALAPIATVAIAAVVGGAFLAGAAVGCAEGRCSLEAESMKYVGDVDGMSVGDLLQSRREAL